MKKFLSVVIVFCVIGLLVGWTIIGERLSASPPETVGSDTGFGKGGSDGPYTEIWTVDDLKVMDKAIALLTKDENFKVENLFTLNLFIGMRAKARAAVSRGIR